MPLQNAFWHTQLPYVFHRIENPVVKHLYLPLNRDYKPLGADADVTVIYEHHLTKALVFARSLGDDSMIYLYSDATCADMGRYFRELSKIMNRKHQIIKGSRGVRRGMYHPKSNEIISWGSSVTMAMGV